MDELSVQLIHAKYSGALNEVSMYMNLAIQTGAVLIGGIVLWRASAILHKRKQAKRERNNFFQTPYSKGWKNR